MEGWPDRWPSVKAKLYAIISIPSLCDNDGTCRASLEGYLGLCLRSHILNLHVTEAGEGFYSVWHALRCHLTLSGDFLLTFKPRWFCPGDSCGILDSVAWDIAKVNSSSVLQLLSGQQAPQTGFEAC